MTSPETADVGRPCVLVTGATGTVGAAVVDELAADASAHTVACVRDPETDRDRLRTPLPGPDAAPDTVDVVAFDFERPETWGPALAGVDRLFLMRPPSVSNDRVAEVAAAAGRVGVERVVYLSVLGAENNPLLPHRRIERAIESLGVDHTFLRASFFMQNLVEVHALDLREHGRVFVPAGGGRTSFVDARDVGAVAARVLVDDDPHPPAYDLTGAEALTYDEVARVFTEVLDRRVEYARPGALRFAREMLARGYPLPFVVVMIGLYTTARVGLAGRVTDDVRRVLGRSPRSLRTFVEDYRDVWTAVGTGADTEVDSGSPVDIDTDTGDRPVS